MDEAAHSMNLSVLLGVLRQDTGDGELILKQGDGVRRLYLSKGELIHLRSEVPGEQFGSYLLRKGVFDLQLLERMLASGERQRLGVKVIQGGLLIPKQRDEHLKSLQEMVMVQALDHPIRTWAWNQGPKEKLLSFDLHFQLRHRHFIWSTFQESHDLADLADVLEGEATWKWKAQGDLLDILGELPLTPTIAYALTFLSADPISFETFHFLSNLERTEAGRLIGTLWALGALALSEGEMPSLPEPDPHPASAKPVLYRQDIPPAPAAPLPNEARVRNLLIEAYRQRSIGSGLDAIRTLEAAASLGPSGDDAYEVWMALGKLRLAHPDPSAPAMAEFRRAARACPGKADPWIALGEIYHGKGFDLDASNCYLRARKLDPSVQIPQEMDFGADAASTTRSGPKKKGILSGFNALLGGGKKSG